MDPIESQRPRSAPRPQDTAAPSPTAGRFAGKVALITGAASGIGLAITRRFICEQALVAMVDLNLEKLSGARDELMRRLFIDLGHAGARGLFCSAYFNGVYKGIFNLCERVREPFFQEHQNSTANWDICYSGDWVDGNATEYNRLTALLDKDLTLLVNYQAAAALLDLENAADYYQLNIYGATWDWPGNNFVLARERSAGPENRFRFAVWDAEGAFYAIGYGGKSVNFNTITADLMPSSTAPVQRIFRRLIAVRGRIVRRTLNVRIVVRAAGRNVHQLNPQLLE